MKSQVSCCLYPPKMKDNKDQWKTKPMKKSLQKMRLREGENVKKWYTYICVCVWTWMGLVLIPECGSTQWIIWCWFLKKLCYSNWVFESLQHFRARLCMHRKTQKYKQCIYRVWERESRWSIIIGVIFGMRSSSTPDRSDRFMWLSFSHVIPNY